jgi:hypothetical protein
MSTHLF